jgi:DNA repair photolyase
MEIHRCSLKRGITRTKEFEKKGLAAYAVNVGTRCGHQCTYCSTPSLMRMHHSFKEAGKSPFAQGYTLVDPATADRVRREAARLRDRGLVQLCTIADAWAPEAQEHQLGRRCLEALVSQPGWSVRVLTKNAAVVKDFDVIERHKDKVLVGLSITGTPDQEEVLKAVEPYASGIRERMAALHQAHTRGLRTYGMFCPMLPGIADDPEQIDELVHFACECGVEEIFAEAVNPRGRGLIVTQKALAEQGNHQQAAAIGAIRNRVHWSRYVTNLIQRLQGSVRRSYDINKLRFLLYPGGLTPDDLARVRQDDAGIVWLGKNAPDSRRNTV